MNELIHSWKKQGKKIVFTNGVFDILHVGHVTYLKQAQALGDVLVVGLNSDDSVKRLNKGPERPIHDEQARKQVLESLRFVDAVIIFQEDTPLHLILSIQPDVLVKGGDYSPDVTELNDNRYMVGSHEIKEWGGKAVAIPLVNGYSTTAAIKKMKS
jgi:D-beta-D-heptose 7-phosphate kinase/D-beta-D-heptose 1-phosphate adenosyltransferase